MAQTLDPKAPTEVVERRWHVPGIQSVTTSASGVTVDSAELDGEDALLTLSGGVAGTIGVITVTVTTGDETLVETFYVPVQASTLAFDDTAQAVVSFALRKIKGVRGTATAAEAADALERLNMMLAAWKATGADVGAMLPLTLDDRIYCEDAHLWAVKHNLILAIADLYGFEPSAYVQMAARSGLSLVKNSNLSGEPMVSEYL